MELFVNPMYEGLRNKMKVMWPEATLAPLLDRITYFATLGSKNSINEIDFPWIDGQVKCLAHINAFQISELGKSVLFLSLLVYAGSLLLRMLHQCCKDSDILDINYASHAKELAECPTEDVPDLIKKIKQEERDMTGVKHPSHHGPVFSSPISLTLFLHFSSVLRVSFYMVQVQEPHLQVERIGKFSRLCCITCRVACCSCVNGTLGVDGVVFDLSLGGRIFNIDVIMK